MLKSTTLLMFLVSACALDTNESTSTLSSASTECEACPDGCVCDPCPKPDEAECTDKDGPVDLDALNFPDDGKVTFCHATSSASNPYVVITTSVSACYAHTTHEHLEKGGHLDIFLDEECLDNY